MLMIEYKDVGWWYWLVTAGLLTFGVSFPIQVRFWYLMLLLVAWLEPLQWIYWIPTIGTWAQIIFGYCTMARCVSLLPWNRSEELSLDMLKKTLFSRPVRGSIRQGISAAQ
jgi:hypothetical protein